MIINKKVLGELLLAAGYGKFVSVSEAELISINSPEPFTSLSKKDLSDFNITIELEPVANEDREAFSPTEVLTALRSEFNITSNLATIDMGQPNTHQGVTLKVASPEQSEQAKLLKYCLEAKKADDLAGTPVIGRKMIVPPEGYSKAFRKAFRKAPDRVAGYDIIWGPSGKKPRQLKRFGQLKGLTIESIKTVKQGTKAYIKTTDGAGICVEHAVVVQDLAPDENIALGLLTKEDLASIAKAKRMGLIP